MTDQRYKNSYNELISTFCIRTFKVTMPMILEVLERMKTETYTERSVQLTHGPVDMFKFIY
jgi:hypothetical protein